MGVVLAVAITVACGSIAPSGAAPTGMSTRTDQGNAMPAITTSGARILRGGEPWWLLGYNSFVWSGNCGNDGERMSAAAVEEWFASMRHDGHGAVRLMFYRGWDLSRLDSAVESARRHNVYLTITLDDANGDCGEDEKTVGWFGDAGERASYEEHMTMLLARYRGETAIAWFEYFNEPDDYGGALRTFYDEMGERAREVDPDRLFSSGTVAPYWLGGEPNFRQVHESPGVDIASLHEYDQGVVESPHGPAVRRNSAGKPVVVGEFGIHASASGTDCEADLGERAARFRRKVAVYAGSTEYVGAFAWAWQPGNTARRCEYGNLDADAASQEVLRTAGGEPDPLGR